MAKVTVYRFKGWDNREGGYTEIDPRWGTREAIGRVKGIVIEASGVDIDDVLLSRDLPGFTERDFVPPPG
jgi:hypothetical protein